MDNGLAPALVRPSERSVVPVKDTHSKRQTPAADVTTEKPHADTSHGDNYGTRQDAKRPGIGWILFTLLIVFGLMGGLFFIGYLPNERRHTALVAAAEQVKSAPLRVSVITPKLADAVSKLILPGEVQAQRETAIFARTSGYLKSWKADIGDRVKAGQLLAEIDAPEIDIQLEQAKSALKQADAVLAQSRTALEQAKAMKNQTATQLGTAKARLDLAEQLKKRYQSLRGNASLNEEMIMEKETGEKTAMSALDAAHAAIATAQTAIDAAQSTIGVSSANIDMAKVAITHLEILKSFENVTAPFDGIITARKTEVGALVQAGSGAAAQALFSLAATDTVRVYVDVPQSSAPAVKDGQIVQLFLREYPKSKFSGVVARTMGALDPVTRTLRTEVRVPNPTGELLAGMYAQITLNVPHQAPPLLVPGSALIVNAAGTQLALVKDGRIHFQPIAIGSDFGSSVGISSGLSETDVVVANPSERLAEGIAVTAIPAAQ